MTMTLNPKQPIGCNKRLQLQRRHVTDSPSELTFIVIKKIAVTIVPYEQSFRGNLVVEY